MLHEFTAVPLIDQSGLVEPPHMLPYGFLVRSERINNIFKGYPISIRHEQQYFNTIMIRHALKVTLHLFRCFHLSHICIINHTLTYSSL